MQSEEIIAGIAVILALGLASQWLAHRIQVPSILLLLGTGLLVGPGLGILDPNEMFGDLLFPIVSISVAIILYEGGLDLNVRELRSIGPAFIRLITVGALVTWIITALAAHYILEVNFEISILLGAILIVSGPTVVIPLLLHIRPARRVSNLLKWEGILIDPVGAIIAVIVLQAILRGDLGDGRFEWASTLGVFETFVIGGIIGGIGGLAMMYALKNYLLPDLYQNMLSLAVVVGIFAASNQVRAESGLFAVIIMGLVLANQPHVSVRRIIDFKENLRVVIISSLFIILAARLERQEILDVLTLESTLFLAALTLIARPVATLISTIGTPFSWRERAFVSWMAPKGIVAAAVASIFGLELTGHGISGGGQLTAFAFLTIIGTVLIYGLTAPYLAKRLELVSTGPSGVLILSAHPLAQELGMNLLEEGFPILLMDSNRTNVQGARLAGLRTHYGNVLSDDTIEDLDLAGIDKFIALTPNDEVNALAAVRMSEIFEERNVYQVAPSVAVGSPGIDANPARHLRGRILGKPGKSLAEINRRIRAGGTIKRTELTEKFTFEDFNEVYDNPIPLFVVTKDHVLRPIAADQDREIVPGDRIISLVEENGLQVRTAVQVSPDRVLATEEMEAAGLIASFCDWQVDVSAGRQPRRIESARESDTVKGPES